MSLPTEHIYGTGEQGSALTDLRNIGRYVARVVQDERIINKYVFCYNEVRSQPESSAIMEGLSGEVIPRELMSRKEQEVDITDALPILQSNGIDLKSEEGAIVAFRIVSKQWPCSMISAGECVVITRQRRRRARLYD